MNRCTIEFSGGSITTDAGSSTGPVVDAVVRAILTADTALATEQSYAPGVFTDYIVKALQEQSKRLKENRS